MSKKMLIDATHAEETRVVVVDGNKVEEFDFESENKRQLAGNIYLAKVTRVEPSLQAAFVDYGGNRHGFLAFSEIHPDYYQIPVADRQALLEEERAYAEAQAAKDDEEEKPKRTRSRSRSRSKSQAAETNSDDAVATAEDNSDQIAGMETVDLDSEEGSSPMERVAETPVEEPESDANDDAAKAEDAPPAKADDAAKAEDADTKDDAQADGEDADGDEDKGSDATAKDDSIESVADEDDSEDIRPVRKPRPRRYKIQEVIKVRQILLVQVVKEERGNKGAALTTYLSLAGRYCVLMPNTARGGGISRKITNAADRKKLKEIATEIEVPKGAGLIVRTAGAKRTKAEIKRDYEYLQRLWEQIRELTLKSIAPAKIYEEGDLIKRSIRDLYNREIDEIHVEGERGYRIAKDFMKMIMPSHAKNVKLYNESLPLFARYQVESYLSGMFNPTVQLPSGGYIVIGVTEALVAIDVNSGRATKEGSIEQTALKTNLEAADEVARQLRLRDLAGLIVIDFIDMDERKNNAAVEKRMKDRLKTDRARIQVGRISGFGLMEMSRQRLRPGMIEATTQPCHACHGTGLVRSDDNLALSIIRQIEEEGTRRRSREVLVRAPVGIANFLMNQKREHIAHIEMRYGMSVRIEGDPSLVSPDFHIEKFKTATRTVPPVSDHVVSVDTSLMDQIDEDESAAEAEEAPAAQDASPSDNGNGNGNGEEGEGKSKRRRRRRRSRGGRGRNGNGDQQNGAEDQNGAQQQDEAKSDEGEKTAPVEAEAPQAEAEAAPAAEEKPKPKSRSRSRKPKAEVAPEAEPAPEALAAAEGEAPKVSAEAEGEETPKPKTKRSRRTKKPAAEAPEETVSADAVASEEEAAPAPKPKRRSRAKAKPVEPVAEATPDAMAEALPSEAPIAAPSPETATPVAEAPQPEPQPDPAPQPVEAEAPAAETAPEPVAEKVEEQPAEKPKPKRRGWWSLGS
ncbi:Rne/Rng family ribonuclease [Sulfitobacter sp. KE29]|uniref:Rne/Rng family ribonuclease n=1 Tax=Sulfitobacter TaxID=60136 RepID=UPI0007C39B76|nr:MULTISPECIES: ribonuclease E/G [Sulfitobacter]KZY50711.1 ribonuclease [Sulfitobacter sp. HI0054]MBO9437579.1 Rne/Rng family ribonuclease [Sulfitobacter sp. R18_2]MDF3417238.1 Rne/Rng family ribonuclease [Sulfitobacter sp. Ks38]MDF3424720.1 Rne/Rng family ribonuclease [Sulfitobacter sp. KE29]MDF3428300.1 Rne/Rng family ribonuclease [Sulfitobacter sp. S46]